MFPSKPFLKRSKSPWHPGGTRGVLGAALIALTFGCPAVRATTPEISLIQRFSTNQVLIHFNTDANRTYTVQYANSLPARGRATWFNLWTSPNLPFANHYIVNDTMTTRQRFYRLSVTP